jgi:membrane protein implicated in regulation of membrane protease activity
MNELLFEGNAGWFTIPALVGTVIFMLRIGLMLVGGIADVDTPDVEMDGGHPGYGDADYAFQILSIQAISAFAAGFGWGGMAAMRSFELSFAASVIVGLVTGAAVMWLFATGMKAMFRLQSSGNTDIRATVGREGEVYTRVPPRGEGRGSVRVVVDDRDRIYNAVSDSVEILRSARVRVLSVNDDNTLLVGPA